MRLPVNRFAIAALILSASAASAADWPQWGGGPTRNPVSSEKGLPLNFQFRQTGDNGKVIKQESGISWKAELGSFCVVPPVVADGLVWVATSARSPGDGKAKPKDWEGGLLMCFRESDGKELWQHRTPRLSGKGVSSLEDSYYAVIGSAPLVDGDHLWPGLCRPSVNNWSSQNTRP